MAKTRNYSKKNYKGLFLKMPLINYFEYKLQKILEFMS